MELAISTNWWAGGVSYTYISRYDYMNLLKYLIMDASNWPSTALVEKKARFLVSSGFSLVNSADLL